MTLPLLATLWIYATSGVWPAAYFQTKQYPSVELCWQALPEEVQRVKAYGYIGVKALCRPTS